MLRAICQENISKVDSPMQLIWSSSAVFCKPGDLKASHPMLTWNNGWSEKHCDLERKTVKILNVFSSQERPVLALQ